MFLGNTRHPYPFWLNILAREGLIIVGSMGVLERNCILEGSYEC